MSVSSCLRKLKELEKAEERVARANEVYRQGLTGPALDLVGAAFTSLALARSKDAIDEEDWKEISGALHALKEAIENQEPISRIEELTKNFKGTIEMVFADKLADCLGIRRGRKRE